MARPERIETLEDVVHWIYDHDGRIDAWWEAQHKWNGKAEKEMRSIADRLSSVEKRVASFAGIAATLGALLGSWLSRVV